MTNDLQTKIDKAKAIYDALTPEQKAAHREEQRRSFVYGNTALENSRITREMVDRVADEMAQVRKVTR